MYACSILEARPRLRFQNDGTSRTLITGHRILEREQSAGKQLRRLRTRLRDPKAQGKWKLKGKTVYTMKVENGCQCLHQRGSSASPGQSFRFFGCDDHLMDETRSLSFGLLLNNRFTAVGKVASLLGVTRPIEPWEFAAGGLFALQPSMK